MQDPNDAARLAADAAAVMARRLMAWATVVPALVVLFVAAILGFPVLRWFGWIVVSALVGVGLMWLLVSRADAMILRLTKAKPSTDTDHPRLHGLVDALCVADGITRPDLHVIASDAPNAFTVGRNHSGTHLVVTQGLLDRLNRVELEGVLAHELAHIRRGDTHLLTVAAATVGAPLLLSDVGVKPLAALGGVSTRLIGSVVDDQQDFLADVTGVAMTRYPPGLTAALQKLRAASTPVGDVPVASTPLWLDAPGVTDGSSARFALHPSLDERIALLQEL